MPFEADPFAKDPTAFTALTKVHKQAITEICFSPDSDQVLTGSEDNTLVLWNLPPYDSELHDSTINDEHKLVCYRLSDHKSPVMAVAINENRCISASKDGQVKLWKLFNANTSRHSAYSNSQLDTTNPMIFKQPSPEPSTYSCHRSIVRSITFSPDGCSFATASDDKSVKIWSTECRNKLLFSCLDGHTNWIKCVRWAKTNDALLASCGDDGKICIWDTRIRVRQPPIVSLSTKRKTQYNCLDWHPVFEHHIATGAQDSAVTVWDWRNGKPVQVYAEHDGSVNSVAFNSGGSLLLSGSSDKTGKIFEVCEGLNLFTLKSHYGPVTSVCFNSTGEMFAMGSQDKTVTIWKRNFDAVNIVPWNETDERLNEAEEDDESNADEFNEIENDISGYATSSSEFRHHEELCRRHVYNKKRLGH